MKFRRFSNKRDSSSSSNSDKGGPLRNGRKRAGSLPNMPTAATTFKPIAENVEESKPTSALPQFNLAAAAAAAAAANCNAGPPGTNLNVNNNNNNYSEMDGDRSLNDNDEDENCLLFEDNSHDDEMNNAINKSNNNGNKKKDDDGANSLERPQMLSARLSSSPTRLGTGTTRPPMEVTIDLSAVPPSPMRDSYLQGPGPDFRPADLLNGNRSSSPGTENEISLRTQLWDAQRLVRVILGKGQANEKPLESGSILQAIQAFAVMKQELITLRKQQENSDGDPPAILEALGSPSTRNSTPMGAATPNGTSSYFSFTPQKGQETAPSAAANVAPAPKYIYNKTAIIEAAKRINFLERQLQQANSKLQQEAEGKPDSQLMEAQKANLAGLRKIAQYKVEQEELQQKLFGAKAKCELLQNQYDVLLKQHNECVEESKTSLDAVVMQLASIPTSKVPQKEAEAIRKKLQIYVQTVGRHSSEARATDLEGQLAILEESSSRKIVELQEKVELQEAELKAYRRTLQMKDDLKVGADDEQGAETKPVGQNQLAALLDTKKEELTAKNKQIEEMEKRIAELEKTVVSQPSPESPVHVQEMEQRMIQPNPETGGRGDSAHVREAQEDLAADLNSAKRSLQQKDTIIKDLEESQLRLQTSVELVLESLASTVGHSPQSDSAVLKGNIDRSDCLRQLQSTMNSLQRKKTVLKEWDCNAYGRLDVTDKPQNSTQRLQLLHEEHKALSRMIQGLEEEMKLGT